MSAIRRRSLLYAANAVPEGWYKPADTPNGVFACIYKNNQIYAIESSVYTANKASLTDYLMGVAVVTADTRIVIIAKYSNNSQKKWDSNETGGLISGVTTANDKVVAQSDYEGKSNSAAAIAALGGKAGAAYACSTITFLNRDTGYLPSAGQMKVIYDNKTEIDNLLTVMEGTNLRTSYYWTSTQAYASNAWRMYMPSGNLSSVLKTNWGYYLPIIDYPGL